MDSIEGMTHHQVGMYSEKRVAYVLSLMVDEGMIRGYRKTRRFSKADKRGIDFYIFPIDGDRIPLQVKSGHRGLALHSEDFFKRNIPCVIGLHQYSYLRRQIKGLLNA